jgi:hypothetical protein
LGVLHLIVQRYHRDRWKQILNFNIVDLVHLINQKLFAYELVVSDWHRILKREATLTVRFHTPNAPRNFARHFENLLAFVTVVGGADLIILDNLLDLWWD